MPTTLSVTEPRASTDFSQTTTTGMTAFLLFAAVAIVMLAGTNIYFDYIVDPAHLPFMGQFVAP